MKYLFLIYQDEAEFEALSDAAKGAVFAGYGALEQELGPTGKRLGGEPLQPTSTATSVRVRDGVESLTDGPFAETREQLGGFYLLDCEDLDEALSWARKIPCVNKGTIEVRPVLDLSGQM